MKHLKVYIFSLLVIAVLLFLPESLVDKENKYWVCGAVLLFTFNTLFSMYRISRSLDASQARFNAAYFGSMALKMLIAFIFIAIYLKFSHLVNIPILLGMVCLYFIYMGFEIQFILYKLRTNSEKSQNGDDARK